MAARRQSRSGRRRRSPSLPISDCLDPTGGQVPVEVADVVRHGAVSMTIVGNLPGAAKLGQNTH
jgi:hypothetical protein